MLIKRIMCFKWSKFQNDFHLWLRNRETYDIPMNHKLFCARNNLVKTVFVAELLKFSIYTQKNLIWAITLLSSRYHSTSILNKLITKKKKRKKNEYPLINNLKRVLKQNSDAIAQI